MRDRLVALDIWRSTLLLFGPLVHAAIVVRTLPGDTSGFSRKEETSRSARTQGFFVIAGFRLHSPILSDRLIPFCSPLAIGILRSLATLEVFTHSRILTFLLNGRIPRRDPPLSMGPATS